MRSTLGDLIDDRSLARAQPLDDLRGAVGHGHEPLALLLGQAPQQLGHQLGAEGGHEPVEARGAQASERIQGHVDGDAVVLAAGLEAVGQLQLEVALLPAVRAPGAAQPGP